MPYEKVVKEVEVPNGERIVNDAKKKAAKAVEEKQAAIEELDSCKQRLSEQVNQRHRNLIFEIF